MQIFIQKIPKKPENTWLLPEKTIYYIGKLLYKGDNIMQTQMVTSKSGGELISFKLNGTERIHQGADCVDEGMDLHEI